MADQLGNIAVGATVRFSFTTHAASGAAVAPSSAFENSDIRIYKDGSATQRSSAAGITMTSPFDSVVGLHHVDIDLSDNTDAGFYATGSNYEVVLVPDETVDSLAVVRVLAQFTIGPTLAAISALIDTINTNLGSVSSAAADGDPTSSDDLFAYVKQIVNTLVGSAGIVTWPASAAPGNAVSIAEALRYLFDQVGVAGAGLSAADDAVITAIGALNNLSQANIRTAVGLASANLDTQLDALPTNAELATALGTADDAVLAAVAAVAAYLDTEIAAILADTNELQTDWVDGGRLDLLVDAIKAKTDNLPSDPADASVIAGLISAVDAKIDIIDGIVDTILVDTASLNDTVLADSVPADGALGTVRQTLYEIRQFLVEKSVSGTTVTTKKVDGSTSLETFTLNDATNPTSITRAS